MIVTLGNTISAGTPEPSEGVPAVSTTAHFQATIVSSMQKPLLPRLRCITMGGGSTEPARTPVLIIR